MVDFFPGLKALIDFYTEIDSMTTEFKSNTGLNCLPFCKACCSSLRGEIEASVFECLPLSIYLWQTGEAEFFLQELDRTGSNRPCLLCNTDENLSVSGGCKFYQWRPLVCRLFGFSAVLDKHGQAKVALCRTIRKADPDAEERINRLILKGMRVPIIPLLAQKASSLNPSLGRKRYAFHLGLKLALEMLGLKIGFMDGRMDEKRQSG